MKKIVLLIFISLSPFWNSYSQINNLSTFLTASEMTLEGLMENLQYQWSLSKPTEEIKDNIGKSRYTFSLIQGEFKQVLQRTEIVHFDYNIRMSSTTLLFNDRKILDRIKENLTFEGFQLKRQEGNQFLYKDGNYTIILKEGATKDDLLDEGYYRIEFLNYGEELLFYLGNNIKQKPDPTKNGATTGEGIVDSKRLVKNVTDQSLNDIFKDKDEPTYNSNADSYYGHGIDKRSSEDRNIRLNGRKVILKPNLQKHCGESGIMVVQIEVNQRGKVVNATPGVKGTTNNSPCLKRIAREAAMETLFNKDDKASSIQVGIIIYNIKD